MVTRVATEERISQNQRARFHARIRRMTDTPASTLSPAVTPPAHVDALPVGTRLAEFEVQALLGVGGFGMVYRAYDHSLHRQVAIKEYMPAALVNRQDGQSLALRSSTDQPTYQSGLTSFIAEARLLAQFDHPSLVKVYRFWEANNTAYMVMPLYSGITLKQARSQMAGPPPEAWLRTVLWSILQALRVLHEHGTVHRDVSPDNIFLQDIGPPVLLDLGAARRAITDQTHQHTAILKVNYAPIEQYASAEDLKPGPWSDLYALAAVIHGCVRNESPPPATFRVVRDSLPTMASVAATVQAHFGQHYSVEFVWGIDHALAIQPSQRPLSVTQLIDEMRLLPPDHLATFDWRAALGSDLATVQIDGLPTSSPAGANEDEWPVTQARDDILLDDGRPDLDLGDEDETRPVALNVPAAEGAAREGRWSGRTTAGLVLAVLGVMGLAYWGWREGRPVQAPLVAAPEPALSPALSRRGEVTATPAPVAAPARAATPRKGKEAAARADDKAASVEKTTPVPAGKATVKTAPAATEVCADSNFITRPMCIHLECQKPGNAKLPVCIEDRQRYPEGGANRP